jgi:hypothetical protein
MLANAHIQPFGEIFGAAAKEIPHKGIWARNDQVNAFKPLRWNGPWRGGAAKLPEGLAAERGSR